MTLLLLLKRQTGHWNRDWIDYYEPVGIFTTDKKLTSFIMKSAVELFRLWKKYSWNKDKKYAFRMIDEHNRMNWAGKGYYNDYLVLKVENLDKILTDSKVKTNDRLENATNWLNMDHSIFKHIEEYNDKVYERTGNIHDYA